MTHCSGSKVNKAPISRVLLKQLPSINALETNKDGINLRLSFPGSLRHMADANFPCLNRRKNVKRAACLNLLTEIDFLAV